MIQIQALKTDPVCRFTARPDTSDIKAIEEVFKKKSYQRKDFRVGSGESWLDLGANVGAFSVYARSKGNRVCAVEAEATNHQILQQNLAVNEFHDVQTYRAAVVHDDFEGDHITFYVNSRPMALRRHSIYQPKKDFQAVDVPVIRWSSLPFDQYPCVKMNIEGAEIDLLEHAKSFHGIQKLVFEYSWDKDPSIARFKAILDKLRGHFRYVDHNKRLPQTPNWTFYPPNIFVFCMA